MRAWIVAFGIVAWAGAASAQTAAEAPPAGAEGATDAAASAGSGDGETGSEPGTAAPAADTAGETSSPPASDAERARPRVAPKVVVVIAGDPDPVLVAAAREIEARIGISEVVRLPSDPSLRAALHGESGADDDGLDEVRRERRRLGLGEASDAPILQALGRRAGAVAVIVVRSGASGAEAVALDVRTGQFFEGALEMTEPDPDAIVPFVSRRARAAARGAVAAAASGEEPPGEAGEGPGPTTAAPGATEADEDDGQDAGEWMEQNWPYFAAGALLAAAIVFVAVTATDGGTPPPMLRFQPGTP